MPGWVTGLAGSIVVSVISAYVFLRIRCRGSGNPFGPLARRWAYTVILLTAAISTGLGLAVVAASGHVRTAYVGLILPSSLWLGKVTADRARTRGSLLPRRLASGLTFPLRRLDGRIGDDMQYWCDARSRAAAVTPQWVADAAQYYYNGVAGRLKDARAAADLNKLRESIQHKIKVLRLVDLNSPVKLTDALRSHDSTRDMHQFTPGDPQLGPRLRAEAEHELDIMLAKVYRLGFHKLLIYPFRAPQPPARRRGPSTSAGAGPAAL